MIFGRVCGNVVSTCKWETLSGSKLLLVEPVDENLKPLGQPFVALDTVGAGNDEVVMVIESREATIPFDDPNTPTDMAIVGIIDEFKTGDKLNKIM
ncbi:MAG: EutN/CcmL family microcompartment protein [Candidatus Wallbacteria bacterium]